MPAIDRSYHTLCGLTADSRGRRYNFMSGDIHESDCPECMRIQALIDRSADNLVEINQLGRVVNISQVVRKIKEQFELSSTRARQEVAHARARKIRKWAGV